MSNHIRCPMCGRNVRYSRIAKKVVRHRQLIAGDILHQEIGSEGVHIVREGIIGDVCPTSGMKEGEVRNLTRTMLAFGNVTVYLHPSNVPCQWWR